jgi:Ca-activated chloride channel homolog
MLCLKPKLFAGICAQARTAQGLVWCCLLSFLHWNAIADIGVLIPADKTQPDPTQLTIAETKVHVLIDKGTATVSLRQIFANKTGNVLEGDYTFGLPSRATLSDFAVWDRLTRIPGVILERREADEAYKRIRAQVIDPGLLSAGERKSDDGTVTSLFTARVVPIPAFGTKRIELQYQERIPTEKLESFLSVPLRPSLHSRQTVGKLELEVELRADGPLGEFAVVSKAYPLQVVSKSDAVIKLNFKGDNVVLAEDLSLQWKQSASLSNQLLVATHRDPQVSSTGYFEARWLTAGNENAASRPPMHLLVLFDGSLSNQWESLERSFLALETGLKSLKPTDSFNVVLFHRRQISFQPAAVAASAEWIEKSLEFVRQQSLQPGTDLMAALQVGLQQAQGSGQNLPATLLLISDGQPNVGMVSNAKIGATFDAAKSKLAQTPKVFAFAASDTPNTRLLKRLVGETGLLQTVRSTEPVEFSLRSLVAKLGFSPLKQVSFSATGTEQVMPLESSVFPGSLAAWVGKYNGATVSTANAAAASDGKTNTVSAKLTLPEVNLDSAHLPRTWAQARVDVLLDKMDREGEDKASIEEVIALSRKFKLVTPYTSFLAAPRALLRPRLIRPGDPVLRVKSDAAIVSITALFSFGLVKQLRFLADDQVWQTRFLAPADMKDGTYPVRLVLRDRSGRAFQEKKSFVVIRSGPSPKIALSKSSVKRGETLQLKVTASENTRQIVARVGNLSPLFLRWNDQAKANVATLTIPNAMPLGKYKVQVTAEDAAHNVDRQEVWLEVLP